MDLFEHRGDADRNESRPARVVPRSQGLWAKMLYYFTFAEKSFLGHSNSGYGRFASNKRNLNWLHNDSLIVGSKVTELNSCRQFHDTQK